MRIEAALERFLVLLQADGRSTHTQKQYRRHVRLLAQWARDVRPRCQRIESLDHEAIARFLAAPMANTRPDNAPKKATAVNCLRPSIKGFFGYLHKAGYIPSDPGRLIRRALCSPPRPRALSNEEQEQLLVVLAKSRGSEGQRLPASVSGLPFHLISRMWILVAGRSFFGLQRTTARTASSLGRSSAPT